MTILPSFLTTLILKTTLIWGPFSSFPGTTLVKVNNNLQQPNQRTLSAFLLPDLASTNVSIIFFNISWHSSTHGLSFFLFLFFFYFLLLRAESVAYGSLYNGKKSALFNKTTISNTINLPFSWQKQKQI